MLFKPNPNPFLILTLTIEIMLTFTLTFAGIVTAALLINKIFNKENDVNSLGSKRPNHQRIIRKTS